MTRLETSRVNEILGLSISAVQEAAARLNAANDLQELESEVAELEKAVAELKSNVSGLPFKHSS